MDFCLPANAPLLLTFAKLPDPRKERNRLYPLIDIVAVVLMGVICAANDIMAAYLWAQHRKEWFVSMGLCLNGLPSYDTLNRLFRYLDPKAFNQCFIEWVHGVARRIQGVIAIDGKTLCNSGDAFRVFCVNYFVRSATIILAGSLPLWDGWVNLTHLIDPIIESFPSNLYPFLPQKDPFF